MSEVKVNKISPRSGTDVQLGDSGDTITVPTGASLTVPNGGLSGQNYPAFEVNVGTGYQMANTTLEKTQFDTEVFDTGNYWDSINYRYLPLVAGKYFVYANIIIQENNSTKLNKGLAYIYKNGSALTISRQELNNYPGIKVTCNTSTIVSMNGSTDYLEVYGYLDSIGYTGNSGEGTGQYSNFGAYRIGD